MAALNHRRGWGSPAPWGVWRASEASSSHPSIACAAVRRAEREKKIFIDFLPEHAIFFVADLKRTNIAFCEAPPIFKPFSYKLQPRWR